MTAKRLLEYLQTVIEDSGEHVPVIVEYPPHRCNSPHGRLPGLARVDALDILYADAENEDQQTEVRLRIERDAYL